jgi:hypothetical protein
LLIADTGRISYRLSRMQDPSVFGIPVDFILFGLTIPLTALALKQGGYDWGPLAYAVGFGGSMIWFGSSAGVAISSIFPEAKSVAAWIKGGWFVPVAYLVGFAVMLTFIGWHPESKKRPRHGRPEWQGDQVSSSIPKETTWQPR